MYAGIVSEIEEASNLQDRMSGLELILVKLKESTIPSIVSFTINTPIGMFKVGDAITLRLIKEDNLQDKWQQNQLSTVEE